MSLYRDDAVPDFKDLKLSGFCELSSVADEALDASDKLPSESSYILVRDCLKSWCYQGLSGT